MLNAFSFLVRICLRFGAWSTSADIPGCSGTDFGMPSPRNVFIASILTTMINPNRSMFIEYCNRHGYE